MDKDELVERSVYGRAMGYSSYQEPDRWITSYRASLALECTSEEVERRIELREIAAVYSEEQLWFIERDEQGGKEIRSKCIPYWKVVDPYVLSEHAKLQEEINDPGRRTERYTRYFARKASDEIECEESRKRIEERVKAELQKRKEQKQ